MNWIKTRTRLINADHITEVRYAKHAEGVNISFKVDGTRQEFDGKTGLAIFKHLSMGAFDVDAMAEVEQRIADRADGSQAVYPATRQKWEIPF